MNEIEEKLNKISDYVNSHSMTNCDKSCEFCCKMSVLTDIKKILLQSLFTEGEE